MRRAAIVEGEGIGVDLDDHVVRAAAFAGEGVQEALARVARGGQLDGPVGHGGAIHAHGHAQGRGLRLGEGGDLHADGDAPRAGFRRRLHARVDDGAIG